jgi:hypothetical protein
MVEVLVMVNMADQVEVNWSGLNAYLARVAKAQPPSPAEAVEVLREILKEISAAVSRPN